MLFETIPIQERPVPFLAEARNLISPFSVVPGVMERKRCMEETAADTKEQSEAPEKRQRPGSPTTTGESNEAASGGDLSQPTDDSSEPSSEPIIPSYPANQQQFTTSSPETDEAPSSCETAGKSSGHRDDDNVPANWDNTPPFLLASGSPRSETSTPSTSPLSRQDPPSQTPPSSQQSLERANAITDPSQLGAGWSLLTQPPSGDLLQMGASSTAVQDLPSDSEERFSTPPEPPPSPSEQAEAEETAFLRAMAKYNQQP